MKVDPDVELVQLLTVNQAAVFLGISRATVYRMLGSGRLPVQRIQIGAETRLSRRQLERWLDDPGPQPHDTARRPATTTWPRRPIPTAAGW